MIDLLWNAPTSEESMTRYIEALELSAEFTAVDIGCGCGEFLIRLCERFGTTGNGIDTSEEHIEEAKRRASGRVSASAIQFEVADAQVYGFSQSFVELGICMGATHAFGEVEFAYQNALQRLIPLVKPGGLILIADGYMKQPASTEYRRLLGDSMPDSMTHARNVAIVIECGLVPMSAWTSSEDEWDNFEWGYQRIVERQAAECPDDSQLADKLKRRRVWMEAYLQYGRNTLGYGTYLFRKPAA